MVKEGSFIKSHDNRDIFVRKWDDVHTPTGIVQIFHGMAEHSARYDDFARFLNRQGYIVYADDHRGHGRSIGDNSILAYIGEDGFNRIVEDERKISEIIKEKYGDLPLYIFSHSFGSFLGQEYIIRYSEDIDGIILSGSAKQDGLDVKAGKILVSIQNNLLDDKEPAKLIDKLSFGSYNSKIKDPKTPFDWLSKDTNEVGKYMDDGLCGYISPINFYYHLFKAFPLLYKSDRLEGITKKLPILVISGDRDPVGKYGQSVKRLYEQYKNLDIQDVRLKLFEGGRHELLNEINKEEVYDYIYAWLRTRS